MSKSKFSESQIIGILKEHEAGTKVADLCRQHGISAPTLYNWKAKYGGLDESQVKRLKALKEENRRLRKLLVEQLLENADLRKVPRSRK